MNLVEGQIIIIIEVLLLDDQIIHLITAEIIQTEITRIIDHTITIVPDLILIEVLAEAIEEAVEVTEAEAALEVEAEDAVASN